jgi:hypothetical protein
MTASAHAYAGPVHRIFLVPFRADLDPSWAHGHWTGQHGDVFAQTPGVLGYVQNRPPPQHWSGRTHVCAEIWFADRAAERASWGSAHYVSAVVEDEARFLDRDQAWLSALTVVRRARRTRKYRVLAFGQAEENATDWLSSWDPDDLDVYALRRQPPTLGTASVLALWTDDLARATDAAAHFGPLSLLAEPKAFIVPPEAPWNCA